MSRTPSDRWSSGRAYERFVGRWSRPIASEFLPWVTARKGLAWGDVGSGTGALTSVILGICEPTSVWGVDSSEGFVSEARRVIGDSRVRFELGDATRVPWDSGARDVTVSGLVLNFVRDHEAMVREMARVTRPGGSVAVYVWDYAGGMEMMRHFWDAATAEAPSDSQRDEASRFPICQPGPLQALFEQVGLGSVTVRAIDVPTVFQSFDDYWTPFLGGTGAAPAYLATVSDEVRERIRARLESRLAPKRGAPIALTARAWAVKGVVG